MAVNIIRPEFQRFQQHVLEDQKHIGFSTACNVIQGKQRHMALIFQLQPNRLRRFGDRRRLRQIAFGSFHSVRSRSGIGYVH